MNSNSIVLQEELLMWKGLYKLTSRKLFTLKLMQVCVHLHTYNIMYLLIIILTDTCLYRLDKDKVVVSELFELLDSVRDQIGIVDWGIKMTTLEDGMTTFSVVINFDCSFFSISQYCEELWEQHYF